MISCLSFLFVLIAATLYPLGKHIGGFSQEPKLAEISNKNKYGELLWLLLFLSVNCWLLIRSTTEILIANNVICWQVPHIASLLRGNNRALSLTEKLFNFNPLLSSWQKIQYLNSRMLSCWLQPGGVWLSQSTLLSVDFNIFSEGQNDLDDVPCNLPAQIKQNNLALNEFFCLFVCRPELDCDWLPRWPGGCDWPVCPASQLLL